MTRLRKKVKFTDSIEVKQKTCLRLADQIPKGPEEKTQKHKAHETLENPENLARVDQLLNESVVLLFVHRPRVVIAYHSLCTFEGDSSQNFGAAT